MRNHHNTMKNDARKVGDIDLGVQDGQIVGFPLWDRMKDAPGVGITNGTGTIIKSSVTRRGGIVKTEILLDLTGLNSGGTAGDIIGKNGAGAAYFARWSNERNGTPLGGVITCLETPAGGDTDIDIYAATEATGVEDVAISTLDETQLVNSGAFTVGLSDPLTAMPADGAYLYLVGQGTANATYTAGRFLIEFWGVDA